MKKIVISLLAFILGGSLVAQPVSDNALVPVAVTLNSILRLNVVSGGNIEFAVNTLTQYTGGISNSDQYDTKFNVASSVDFNVHMEPEDNSLVGTDAGGNMSLDNIGYVLTIDGTGDTDNWSYQSSLTALQSGVSTIVSSVASSGAGGSAQNAWIINWELGTSGGGGMNTYTLLEQSIDADRYATNIVLQVVAQ